MEALSDILSFKFFKEFINELTVKAGFEMPFGEDKKVAELKAKLETLNYKYCAIFECRNSYHILFDRHLRIVDFNRGANILIKKLYGKHMAIGDTLHNYLPVEAYEIATQNSEMVFAGKTIVVEKKVVNSDGSNNWWSFQHTPAYDLKGHITGLTFSGTDITERKAHEEKIELQNKKLREIALMQSHEIRGPLSTVMGLMNLIKEDAYTADPQTLMLMEQTVNTVDQKIRGIVANAGEMCGYEKTT